MIVAEHVESQGHCLLAFEYIAGFARTTITSPLGIHSFRQERAVCKGGMAPSASSDDAHIQEVKLQRLQGGQASTYFVATIAGLILIFAAAHWTRRLCHRLFSPSPSSRSKSYSTFSASWLKFIYGRKIRGFNILPERVALAVVYFGINVGASVWDIDWHHYTTFANRLGW